MNKEKANRFFIYVHVKSYVYAYFMNKYHIKDEIRNAVSLNEFNDVMTLIRYRLKKTSNRRESEKLTEYTHRKHILAVHIPTYNVQCMGTELSFTDESDLAKLLEKIVWQDMIIYVTLHNMFGMPISHACQQWKDINSIEEDDWRLDSMIRICSRNHLYLYKREFNEFLEQQIDKIIAIAKRGKIDKRNKKMIV